MRVRIRYRKGSPVIATPRNLRRLAVAIAALLSPIAVVAAALAFWRVAADLKLAASFGIPSGVFSHWQVWLAAALFLQICSWLLNRYGGNHDRTAS
jgi:hypothetical protein